MSFDSYVSRNGQVPPIVSPRGTNLEDAEFIKKEMGRSQILKQSRYMSSLQSGSKIRNNLSSNELSKISPDRSDNRSSSSLGSIGPSRSINRQSENGNSQKPPPNRRNNMDSSVSVANHPRYNASTPKMNPQKFMHILNENLFSRFANEELFYQDLKESIIKRVHDNAHRSNYEDLQDITYEVLEACRSTKLNLDAVVQWKLGRLDHSIESSVIDHIFLIHINIMCYDPKYSRTCIEKFCVDPLCCDLHRDFISEYDKARSFLRTINIILNEAVRTRILSKDQKASIRSRLGKSHFSIEDRTAVIREMALLIMLGQTDRYKDLSIEGIKNVGLQWSPPLDLLNDLDAECSLDPDKVLKKANFVSSNPFLESILNVKKLGLGITNSEYDRLHHLWKTTVPQASESEKFTIPMLLHILVHSSESDLQKAVSEAAIKDGLEIQPDRINQIEDLALQAVQNLGLAWELGDNPPRDLRQFCMAIILDLGTILHQFIIKDQSTRRPDSMCIDSVELIDLDDSLFGSWFETCTLFARHEKVKKSFLIFLLFSHISITSERLLSQKADFNPEIFLVVVLELLTEFRKRRPNYNAICINADYNFISPRDVDGKPIEIARANRESIGTDFDRLYSWINSNFPQTNRIRQLLRPVSPKSSYSANSRNQIQMSSPPNEASGMRPFQEAALMAADLADSMNLHLNTN
ncbi:hypothetical protein BB560_001007 [Smittium megazygosporum]|uniref:Uncharacterized protein n=1 Tax=Smittium megazygosporum TaxID=133381 RepID=A0A2T9ZJ02_9FUNG|nr:hypothetical protein BB560_001009 [Smittium megazygosporum]PVV04499.1 hypothetical protein BB560_001007 [Smittium megazygosporum]